MTPWSTGFGAVGAGADSDGDGGAGLSIMHIKHRCRAGVLKSVVARGFNVGSSKF